MIKKFRFTPELILELLHYCKTDVKTFSNSGLWELSQNTLYLITNKKMSISENTQNHLNDVFFNKIGLTYQDVLEVYKLIEIKKRNYVKYKQAVQERKEDKNE